MTRATNARIAGFTFLFYIAVALPGVLLFDRATAGVGVAAKVASTAAHAADVRLAFVLMLLGCFAALVLAVTLYGQTREVDHELAMVVLVFRLGEGVIGAAGLSATLGLLWLASPDSRALVATPATADALGAILLMPGPPLGATFFAVASTVYAVLLLRGRLVPSPLAWLGLLASVLLAVGLPLHYAGYFGGTIARLLWLPMLAFEVPLGIWLLVKGATEPGPLVK